MSKQFLKMITLAVAVLFFAATVAVAAQTAEKEDPIAKFFRRLFGWPAKTAVRAGKTAVDTTVEAGKTGAKTVETTGKVLIGKETPEKLVTTPVTGAAKTGEAAVVGSAKTAGTIAVTCPVVPESQEKKAEEALK